MSSWIRPFLLRSGKGTVDLVAQSHRVINKVRPLINDGGLLIAINNALFVSGAEYLHMLETLCADGYLAIEEFIPVPPDCTGYPETRVRAPAHGSRALQPLDEDRRAARPAQSRMNAPAGTHIVASRATIGATISIMLSEMT